MTTIAPDVRLVNGLDSYLHADALGSIRLITNDAGAWAERRIYHPFGEMEGFANPDAIATASEETRGWIGERFDAGAGLQYLNARYYDPELGLFLQPDWFEVTGPGVGTNRYAYSFNDPVNLMDPGGNYCVPCAAVIAKLSGDGLAFLGLGGTAVATGIFMNSNGMSIDLDGPDLSFEGKTAFPEDGARILDTPTQQPEPWVEGFSTDGPQGGFVEGMSVPEWQSTIYVTKLRDKMGLRTGDSGIAHHNIPVQAYNLPLVQLGIRGGYDFNGAMNGTIVVGQQGGHPAYNTRIIQEVKDLFEEYGASMTPAQARNHLETISERERARIEEEGNFVSNK